MVKIGDVVLFEAGQDAAKAAAGFVIAAIVTMTPSEWQPGYRTPDGEWVPQTAVAQPKAGCVHLHVFWPTPTTPPATPFPADYGDVPLGTGPHSYQPKGTTS